MASLLEMAGEIVSAHVSSTPMTKDELLKEIQEVYAALVALEKGESVSVSAAPIEEEFKPAISAKKSIGKNSITCLICGKQMKTLARHLGTEHGLKPGDYRKQFGIPRTQALAAKSYSESRKQMAIERGLGDNLAKARAARGEKKAASPKGKAKVPRGKKAAAPAGE